MIQDELFTLCRGKPGGLLPRVWIGGQVRPGCFFFCVFQSGLVHAPTPKLVTESGTETGSLSKFRKIFCTGGTMTEMGRFPNRHASAGSAAEAVGLCLCLPLGVVSAFPFEPAPAAVTRAVLDVFVIRAV